MAKKKKTSVTAFLATIAALILFSFLPDSLQSTIKDLIGVGDSGGMSTSVDGLPKTASSYSTAKKYLYEDVHAGHRETLYCGCDYDSSKNVDLKGCGMSSVTDSRAKKVEAEHVVPASYMGGALPCWTQELCTDGSGKSFKGRDCCQDIDPAFNAAHNDLHNLFPSVGEVNGARGNYLFGEVSGSDEDYGDCDFRIDRDADRVEPPDRVKGDVARTWFYMEETYGVSISSSQRAMFESWSKQDPPDSWERERNDRVARLQGKANPFIK